MPSYLDLVYNGSYLARYGDGAEYWRMKEDIFVVYPEKDFIFGPVSGAILR